MPLEKKNVCTNIEIEIATLSDELMDAQGRLEKSDDEGRSIIQRQIRQVKRQIASYQEKLYEKQSI